jgi:type I restriction enzyme S subunit
MDIYPEERSKFTALPGDLLVCEGGESGRAAIWNGSEPIGIQNAIHRIRPKAELDARYLLYYFEWQVKSRMIDHLLSGVTITHFTQEKLRRMEIQYPPLDEQQRIVKTVDDHLSRLDKALAEVTSALQKFETLERSTMAIHFSASPDGESKRVVKIAEVTEKAKSLDPKSLGKESFKYVDIGSISPDSETPNVSAWTPTSAAPSRARQHIQSGDVVFSTVRPYQKKIAIVDQDLDGHIASTGFCVLRPKPGLLDTRYLFHYLKSDALMDQVLPLQRGASYPAVGDSDVKNSTIPLPDLASQVAIAEELDEVVGTVKMMKSQLQDISRTANSLRRSVLHSAFSGKLLEEK